MTVKELITRLSSFPEDMKVLSWDCEFGFIEFSEVEKQTIVEDDEDEDFNHISRFDVNPVDPISAGDAFIGIGTKFFRDENSN